jgi:hypothetical protein
MLDLYERSVKKTIILRGFATQSERVMISNVSKTSKSRQVAFLISQHAIAPEGFFKIDDYLRAQLYFILSGTVEY